MSTKTPYVPEGVTALSNACTVMCEALQAVSCAFLRLSVRVRVDLPAHQAVQDGPYGSKDLAGRVTRRRRHGLKRVSNINRDTLDDSR